MPEVTETKLNRRQRRAFRRALHREYRLNTRFWRRAWRGVMPQHDVAIFVKERQRRAAAIDNIYGAGVLDAA
jgi:hypothetical protein